MSIAEPHKELRFTRAGQGTGFGIAGAIAIMAGITLFAIGPYRGINPALPHPAWGILPLLAGLLLMRTAVRCARHAYILLTPIGVEIFPFFRPQANMQVIPWAQIAAADIDDSQLTLHFSMDKTAGIHLSLKPLRPARRELLARAIRGRLSPPVSDI